MESKAKFLGHPIHPMLVVFPLGLLATAVIFDVMYLVARDGKWAGISYYMIAAGILGGIAAAMFGWVDWFAIPAGTRAKRVGLLHGFGNVLVLLLFMVSWALRGANPGAPPPASLALSFAGFLLAAVTGWLGGELVDRLGVGVDDDASLNAPSSLKRPRGGSRRGGARYTGAERRVGTVPAYAGSERRAGVVR
jgi:uncharacterized membrane protein